MMAPRRSTANATMIPGELGSMMPTDRPHDAEGGELGGERIDAALDVGDASSAPEHVAALSGKSIVAEARSRRAVSPDRSCAA
jgi:hypothetical protein